MWITLWITCGYVDNFLFMYVFVLCVYGFLWCESDKFYMFQCVVDNFVDNLCITHLPKQSQKINRYTYIDKGISNRQKEKEKEKTPGKMFRGFGGLCVSFVLVVAVVVTLRVL